MGWRIGWRRGFKKRGQGGRPAPYGCHVRTRSRSVPNAAALSSHFACGSRSLRAGVCKGSCQDSAQAAGCNFSSFAGTAENGRYPEGLQIGAFLSLRGQSVGNIDCFARDIKMYDYDCHNNLPGTPMVSLKTSRRILTTVTVILPGTQMVTARLPMPVLNGSLADAGP